MADAPSNPFGISPGSFINFAQQMQEQPMAGRVPVSSFGLSPGQGALGPTHAALQARLGLANEGLSSGIQSLLAQILGGGNATPTYAPPSPTDAFRINFNGPGGFGSGQFGDNMPILARTQNVNPKPYALQGEPGGPPIYSFDAAGAPTVTSANLPPSQTQQQQAPAAPPVDPMSLLLNILANQPRDTSS